MLISTRGRYALRVLTDMAEHDDGGYLPLKEVAARQGISEKYLESVLKVLVRSGILTGMRGKGGGYRLALPPGECTVGQVLRLTEETLAPVACLEPEAAPCPRSAQCRTLAMWQGLDRVIGQYLCGITIGDLIEGK